MGSVLLRSFLMHADDESYPLFNAFLPQYLKNVDPSKPPESVRNICRNFAIISMAGCQGPILAYFTVDMKYLGRRGTMAICTLLTGVFLFLFVTNARSDFQLAFNCLVAFL